MICSIDNAAQLCFGPLSIQDFVSNKWEREPVLFEGCAPNRFAQLMSLDVFDQLVSSSNLHYPCFRVFNAGELVSPDELTTDRQVGADIDPNLAELDSVYEAAANGGTIVLQALEKCYQPLTQLCSGVQQIFGAPTQAYAYHTPPFSAGPPAHYDTHEVFVLQVEGRKHWRIWPSGVELPLRLSEDSYDHQAVVQFAEQNSPVVEHELQPGEGLYIPRGFVHAADTNDSRSLHVSVSVMIWRWLDLFRTAVDQHLEVLTSELALRHAITFGRRPGSPVDTETYSVLRRFVDELSMLELRESSGWMRPEYKRASSRDRRDSWSARLAATTPYELARGRERA